MATKTLSNYLKHWHLRIRVYSYMESSGHRGASVHTRAWRGADEARLAATGLQDTGHPSKDPRAVGQRGRVTSGFGLTPQLRSLTKAPFPSSEGGKGTHFQTVSPLRMCSLPKTLLWTHIQESIGPGPSKCLHQRKEGTLGALRSLSYRHIILDSKSKLVSFSSELTESQYNNIVPYDSLRHRLRCISGQHPVPDQLEPSRTQSQMPREAQL